MSSDKFEMQSQDLRELHRAMFEAQREGFEGICLTNGDPKADWAALVRKNSNVLKKHNISVKEFVEKNENGDIYIETVLFHDESGQYKKSSFMLDAGNEKGASLECDSPEVFLIRRMIYECLLGIASSNDAIEAEIFGSKGKYCEISDKTKELAAKIILGRRMGLEDLLGVSFSNECECKAPPFRAFSWTDMKLSLQCKSCFYIKKKLGIKPPLFDSEGFKLPTAVDTLLKKEFDNYRMGNKAHPIMANTNIVKPLRHRKIKGWKDARWSKGKAGGIQFQDVWGNYLTYGGVDDVWLNEKNELVVVEYKTLAEDRINKNFTNIRYLDLFKKQVEYYAWLFRKNNYTVCSTGYILFCNALTEKESFDWKLEFEPYLFSFEVDDSWVQPAIDDALKCLESEILPGLSFDCVVCKYLREFNAKIKPFLNKKAGKK